MPWYDKSDWVAPTATPEIEEFIEKVRADLFNNPGKKIWVKDNPERSETEELKNFRNWNKEGNDKIIRIQDKSARLKSSSRNVWCKSFRKINSFGFGIAFSILFLGNKSCLYTYLLKVL